MSLMETKMLVEDLIFLHWIFALNLHHLQFGSNRVGCKSYSVHL